MTLADSDLLMLVNLTYMNQDTKALVKGLQDLSKYSTIGEYLAIYTEDALTALEEQGDIGVNGGNSSGLELAAILRYMKDRPYFHTLRIACSPVNTNGHTMAYCLEDTNDPTHGIVIFPGTLDEEEWKDNAKGLYLADTDAQIQALSYIKSLPYSAITVAGHSKGGNKAQYVSILSENVYVCRSFDGQGFSQEFLTKYSDRITKHAGKIKSYSLSTDFIHPFLYAIPGATLLYVYGGTDVKKLGEHHSPSSFFEYDTDEYGQTQIVCFKDGTAYLPLTVEFPGVQIIRSYSNYIQSMATKEDKAMLGTFVGDLLSIQYGREASSGKRRSLLWERLFRQPEELATLLAYTITYIDTYQLNNLASSYILRVLGLTQLQMLLKLTSYDIDTLLPMLRLTKTTKEKDLLLYHIFLLMDAFTGFRYHILHLWEAIDRKYHVLMRL